MDQGLIDRIYESAFTPESWPAVLDEISGIAGARGGSLLTANDNVLGWTASQSMSEVWEALQAEGLMVCGDRFNRLLALRHNGFLSELDSYGGESEMGEDPLYRKILWPLGLGWAAATAVTLPTGDTMVLTFERDRARGPADRATLDKLDALRPHLARSALLSARLQLERASAAGETLAALGIPALVLDATGRVLAANPLIEAMSGRLRWRGRDRVSLADPAADALFQPALAALGSTGPGAAGRGLSLALRGDEHQAAAVAHLVPIRGDARDIFVRCAGVLALTPVTLPNAAPAELVQSLFDLTPAEARVARRLGAGETVAEIAAASGLAAVTVRNQIRGVLRKTGCRRQAEVVALLGGLRVVP
ncbi:helix-turn-helix transcriptional regulator [Phenylobacterium sp.]|uniref:helix-turn-helix transcriptional regulator n=1 Tax=Phenylobacterium sp. TaxID=1871053 RepID=UPI00374D38B7